MGALLLHLLVYSVCCGLLHGAVVPNQDNPESKEKTYSESREDVAVTRQGRFNGDNAARFNSGAASYRQGRQEKWASSYPYDGDYGYKGDSNYPDDGGYGNKGGRNYDDYSGYGGYGKGYFGGPSSSEKKVMFSAKGAINGGYSDKKVGEGGYQDDGADWMKDFFSGDKNDKYGPRPDYNRGGSSYNRGGSSYGQGGDYYGGKGGSYRGGQYGGDGYRDSSYGKGNWHDSENGYNPTMGRDPYGKGNWHDSEIGYNPTKGGDRWDDYGRHSYGKGGAGTCVRYQVKCKNGTCVDACDGNNDCGDYSDEFGCPPCNKGTPGKDFKCQDGTCIAKEDACDGQFECSDKSDEFGCPPCSRGEFKCKSGICIDKEAVCDGIVDCSDETTRTFTDDSDESNCGGGGGSGGGCGQDKFKCRNKNCVAKSERCDSQNDCGDNSDEFKCEPCNGSQFRCFTTPTRAAPDTRCIPKKQACDGKNDCSDGSDEFGCVSCTESQFRCANGQCITLPKCFEGRQKCLDGSDCPA